MSDEDITDEESARSSGETGRTSVGEDVIGRKGVYGRFAEKWFSKRGWTADRRRAEGMSSEEERKRQDVGEGRKKQEGVEEEGVEEVEEVDIRKPENRPAPNTGSESMSGVDIPGDGAGDKKVVQKDSEVTKKQVEDAKEAAKEDVAHNLTPKLLHTTRLLLESRSFFFSYEWDITRAWSTQRHSASASLPLHKLVDPLVSFHLIPSI